VGKTTVFIGSISDDSRSFAKTGSGHRPGRLHNQCALAQERAAAL
jgi:hypothetical protein